MEPARPQDKCVQGGDFTVEWTPEFQWSRGSLGLGVSAGSQVGSAFGHQKVILLLRSKYKAAERRDNKWWAVVRAFQKRQCHREMLKARQLDTGPAPLPPPTPPNSIPGDRTSSSQGDPQTWNTQPNHEPQERFPFNTRIKTTAGFFSEGVCGGTVFLFFFFFKEEDGVGGWSGIS